jgi:uncharacterized membrane protein
MLKQIIILSLVLLVLDIIWITNIMQPRYSIIVQNLTGKDIQFRYLPAILAYIIMIFGIYYFAVKDKKSSYDALVDGCLLGLVMYGVYDTTLYAVFPIDDTNTAILDVVWGMFVCGITAYISHYINILK